MGGDATQLASNKGRQQANGEGSKSKHDDSAIDVGVEVIEVFFVWKGCLRRCDLLAGKEEDVGWWWKGRLKAGSNDGNL